MSSRRRTTRQLAVFLAICYLVLGLGLFATGWFRLGLEAKLDDHARTTQGTITERMAKGRCQYTFSVGETSYDGSGQAWGAVGSPIVIDYLPENPSTSRLRGGSQRLADWLFIVLGAMSLIMSVVSVIPPGRVRPDGNS